MTNSQQMKSRQNARSTSMLRLAVFSWLMAAVLNLFVSLFAAAPAAAQNSSELRASDPSVRLLNPFAGIPTLDPQQLIERLEDETLSVYSTNSLTSPLASAVFDLVRYMRRNQIATNDAEIDATIPRYNRIEMFGGWVNEDSPANCYNTRAEILLRDTEDSNRVTFSPSNPCQVIRGDWLDPYTGDRFKLAKAVQIDHVVPLKNAYRSGAHQWGKERRCHYSNFLHDPVHLLTVSGHENMSKGDSGPNSYLPPNEEYVCTYLRNWMQIKAVWSLGFTDIEANAIHGALTAFRCDGSHGQMTTVELNAKRAATTRMNVKCLENTEAASEAARPPLRPAMPLPPRGSTYSVEHSLKASEQP